MGLLGSCAGCEAKDRIITLLEEQVRTLTTSLVALANPSAARVAVASRAIEIRDKQSENQKGTAAPAPLSSQDIRRPTVHHHPAVLAAMVEARAVQQMPKKA